jgi:2,3,4,5-tetrahydropyridine-2-carboxylate N-succinyltransferase
MAVTFAAGLGIGTKNAAGAWLEVFYPHPVMGKDADALVALAKELGLPRDGAHEVPSHQLNVVARVGAKYAEFAYSKKPVVLTILATNAAPASVPDAYLKLHLLSHRLVKPHGTNLTGVFRVLPNVAWTSRGAIDLADLPAAQLAARLAGHVIDVFSVDKFPKMTDYVVPSGVRIADTARVRLGAYVGEGTTVMHEGFINFNAGAAGPNMVEGRISAGVMVGAGSDLGGGASTMGTLSGGGDVVISVGKNCLIGANAGLGIPLGDNCTIESGLYLTAASKVRLTNRAHERLGVVKAAELAGKSNLLFRRNSQDGAIECLPVKSAIALNDDLHVNN